MATRKCAFHCQLTPVSQHKEAQDKAVATAAPAATAAAAAAAAAEPAVESPREATGFFELHALVTHQGRTPDSGHYVSFVRDRSGTGWVEFDDERPIPRSVEHVLKLKGGAAPDSPMTYLCLYRSVEA